jgi:hypothetical protein
MSEHETARNGALHVEHPLPGYGEVRRRSARLRLRAEEVPTGHEVSLPLPTLRWGRPGYASYAGPAVRAPGAPLRLGTPDRWWLVRADDLRLVTYSLVTAVEFSPDLPDGPVVLPPSGRSREEGRLDDELFNELMTAAVPMFFAGDRPTGTLRADLAAVLGAVVPAEVRPWTDRLAPDFFGWLTGASA